MVTIEEKRDYVNTARETKQSTQVYDYADLNGTAISNLPSDTRVKLTGVIGSGVAQIKEPVMGWVSATNLRVPTAGRGARYRVRSSTAPNGLVAYDGPGQSKNDGPAGGATVVLVEPQRSYVEGGRKFIQVFYIGRDNKEYKGYVSQGATNSVLGQSSSNFEGPV